MILNQRIAQEHLTLHAYVQRAADAHDQQNHDGGTDTRQSNVPHLLETIGAVHLSGFIETGVDACHGGKVNEIRGVLVLIR